MQAGHVGPVVTYTTSSVTVKTVDTAQRWQTRVGIDLVSIDEVQHALEVHGWHYLDRVFTNEEQRECGLNAPRLAARFAAKEATMKALDCGNAAIPWRSIGVQRAASGRFMLELTGGAAELARRHGIGELSLSLTHEGSSAAAIVLAQQRPDD
jgi:holo-[acyl-carrier protein] synthase